MNQETEFTDSFLNDVERDALITAANNPTLIHALKKVLLADVYFKGTLRAGIAPDPTRNAAFALAFGNTNTPNEVLGQDIRAQAEAVRLVEGGFTRFEKFKSAPKEDKTPKKTGR